MAMLQRFSRIRRTGKIRLELIVSGACVVTGLGACSDGEPSRESEALSAADAGVMDAGAAPRVAIDAGVPIDVGPARDAGPAREVFRPEERPATDSDVARLVAPAGFTVSVFARDLEDARMLLERGGIVYVTRPQSGDVLALADTDGDGAADTRSTVASDLPYVHGIAFRDSDVYLATDTRVLRGTISAEGGFDGLTAIIEDLPDGGQHPLRTLGIGPDDRLYISVGSTCDACEESNPENATMLVAALDGTGRSVLASGLRNTIGFGWHPATGELWGMDHGSDWRGNDLPPEELNQIVAGADYGWPYCFGERQVDPVIDDPPDQTKAERCAMTTPSVLTTQAHNAPIGLVFYAGQSFPEAFRNDAFVAMHGSWNRYPPTGYKVSRIVFDDAGRPTAFEDFVSGFLIEEGRAVFGRPAGITVSGDGTLLFSDDANGVVYRVAPSVTAGDAGAPPSDAGP